MSQVAAIVHRNLVERRGGAANGGGGGAANGARTDPQAPQPDSDAESTTLNVQTVVDEVTTVSLLRLVPSIFTRESIDQRLC